MISICIATYNGARYIAEQLASILKQLSAEDEVVVSDDGSTDGTLDIVRRFKDHRIRIVDDRGATRLRSTSSGHCAMPKANTFFLQTRTTYGLRAR